MILTDDNFCSIVKVGVGKLHKNVIKRDSYIAIHPDEQTRLDRAEIARRARDLLFRRVAFIIRAQGAIIMIYLRKGHR